MTIANLGWQPRREGALNIETSLATSLTLLGYSPVWLEWGLLNEATLQAQIADYQTGPDKRTEHYRYSAFRQILSSRSALTETEIEQYLALAEMDADRGMSQSARVELILWSGLTAEQFERLSHQSHFAASLFQKLISRRRLLTELALSSLVSAQTFEKCLVSRDATLQRQLITHCKLSPEQLQTLSEQGVSKAIRNMARNRGH